MNTKERDKILDKLGLEEKDPQVLRDRIKILEEELRQSHQRGVTPLRIPSQKASHTVHAKISTAGIDGRLTGRILVEIYDDGMPGEVETKMDVGEPIVKDLVDALGILMTTALQYGVPLEVILKRLDRRNAHDGIIDCITKCLRHQVELVIASKKEAVSKH